MAEEKRSVIYKLNYLMDRKIKLKMIFVFLIIFIGSFVELLGVAVIYPIVNLIMDNDYAENIWCNILLRFN